jgi:hypothetical protein
MSADQYSAIFYRNWTHQIRIEPADHIASNGLKDFRNGEERDAVGVCRTQVGRVMLCGEEKISNQCQRSPFAKWTHHTRNGTRGLHTSTDSYHHMDNPTLNTTSLLSDVAPYQRRCLCNDMEDNMRINNAIKSARISREAKVERGDRTRGKPCGGSAVITRTKDNDIDTALSGREGSKG